MTKYLFLVFSFLISSVSNADNLRTDCINKVLAEAGVGSGTEYRADLDTLILYENYPNASGGSDRVQSVYTTAGAIHDNTCIPKSTNSERELSVKIESLFVKGYSRKSSSERANYLNSLLYPCEKASMNRLKTVLNKLRSNPNDSSVVEVLE